MAEINHVEKVDQLLHQELCIHMYLGLGIRSIDLTYDVLNRMPLHVIHTCLVLLTFSSQ